MRNWRSGHHFAAADQTLNRTTWVVLGGAGLLGAVWLWNCWCSFPSNPWNDIRIAPAIALHHGISVFNPAGSGPASTWAYGPLPPLLMWPAGLASTAIGAIEAAGALHIGLWVLTFALISLHWPATQEPASRGQDRQRRLAAMLLCILLVRNETSGYTVYTADAPGMMLGLLGMLALVRGHYWTAAACATAAVACKQILVGVGAAQVLWLFIAVSPRAAAQQIGRGLVTTIAGALLAVWFFGGPGLWHTLFDMPGRYPWAPIAGRLSYHYPYLLLHIGMPLAIMLAGWRFFFQRKSPGLLPGLMFICTLPFSLAAFLKVGGNVNSLHSFWLWFPPGLVALVTGKSFTRWGPAGGLALAMLPAMVASLWLQLTFLRLRPNIQAYREATELAQRLPQQVWFPMHPIVTLYSDHRFYHDYDGLLARAGTGYRLSDRHYFAHMPADRKVVATLLPIGWGPANTAEARLPVNTPVTHFGTWQLQLVPEGNGRQAASP